MQISVKKNRKPAKKRMVPATKEKACTICGLSYVYPTKGSAATRHKCELCVQLPEAMCKTLKRLNDRVRHLEAKVAKLEAGKADNP